LLLLLLLLLTANSVFPELLFWLFCWSQITIYDQITFYAQVIPAPLPPCPLVLPSCILKREENLNKEDLLIWKLNFVGISFHWNHPSSLFVEERRL